MHPARSALMTCVTAAAALIGAPDTRARETAHLSILRPPQGVAVVVFEDLQCVGCAQAAPQIEAAARAFGVPVVRHDFPLPWHLWAERAAAWARYFESRSAETGREFRSFIFARQLDIRPDTLTAVAEQFAVRRGVPLPGGSALEAFTGQVKDDVELGRKIGIRRAPTVNVVSSAALRESPQEVFSDRDLATALQRATRKAATFPMLAWRPNGDCGCEAARPDPRR